MVKKNKVSVADKKKKLYNRAMDEKGITDQTTRINKYLSAAGVCSRREADQLTDAGRVTVAGKEIGTGERIPADAEVFLDGRPVKAETRQVLCFFIIKGIVQYKKAATGNDSNRVPGLSGESISREDVWTKIQRDCFY